MVHQDTFRLLFEEESLFYLVSFEIPTYGQSQEYSCSSACPRSSPRQEYFFARCRLETHDIYIFTAELYHYQALLIKGEAEADIYIVEWNSKKRFPKSPTESTAIETWTEESKRYRTIHEASLMSSAKSQAS